LAISNIGPRSVTLQYKPGYDGKTSISRWQVEAQVGHSLFKGVMLSQSRLDLCLNTCMNLSLLSSAFRWVSSERMRIGWWSISWPMSLMLALWRSPASTPTPFIG